MKKITMAALLVSVLSAGATYHLAYAGEKQGEAVQTSQVMAFKQGDRIPLSLSLGGDLIEAENQPTQYVTVKRDFWLRIIGSKFEMSLDGSQYKPLNESVAGNLSLTTGLAGEMAVGLQAFLR